MTITPHAARRTSHAGRLRGTLTLFAVLNGLIVTELGSSQNPALFVTSQPFGQPLPPALQGVDLPASLGSFLQLSPVREVVAWDFDGDQDDDFLLCNGNRCYLLRNGPGLAIDQPWGVFSDASSTLATPAMQWGLGGLFFRDFVVEAAAVGDIDGDGRQDLVAASSQTTRIIFTVTVSGGQLVLNPANLNAGNNWGALGWSAGLSFINELVLADVKGGAFGSGPPDGILDIVVARGDSFITTGGSTIFYPGRARVAVNTGNGIDFVDVSPPSLPLSSSTAGDTNGQTVAVVDVDGVFGPDIVLAVLPTVNGPSGTSVPGTHRLYLNQPTGWQEVVGAFPPTNLAGDALRARAIDFNGDALIDLALVTTNDTRILLRSGSAVAWSVGPTILVPSNAARAPTDLVSADFDGDGFTDLLDPYGSYYRGSLGGLVQTDVVVTNQLVTTLTHGATSFGMVGDVADVDWDGDLDWVGVSVDPSGVQQFDVWANVTRQLDSLVTVPSNTLPRTVDFWCYDRAVDATVNINVMPFLAVDLGPLPVRVPVPPYGGLLGLNPGVAVSIGAPTGLFIPLAAAGAAQRAPVPVGFSSNIPPGTVLYYQALNIRIQASGAMSADFTNVLRVSVP